MGRLSRHDMIRLENEVRWIGCEGTYSRAMAGAVASGRYADADMAPVEVAVAKMSERLLMETAMGRGEVRGQSAVARPGRSAAPTRDTVAYAAARAVEVFLRGSDATPKTVVRLERAWAKAWKEGYLQVVGAAVRAKGDEEDAGLPAPEPKGIRAA